MDADTLLRQMNTIARKLINPASIEDFSVHDAKFICTTQAKTPFIWLVCSSGTSMHRCDLADPIQKLLEVLRYFEKSSVLNFQLYHYDLQNLKPAFPSKVKEMIQVELRRLQPTNPKELDWSNI